MAENISCHCDCEAALYFATAVSDSQMGFWLSGESGGAWNAEYPFYTKILFHVCILTVYFISPLKHK